LLVRSGFLDIYLTFREELTKDNFQIADDALGIRERYGVFGELS